MEEGRRWEGRERGMEVVKEEGGRREEERKEGEGGKEEGRGTVEGREGARDPCPPHHSCQTLSNISLVTTTLLP